MLEEKALVLARELHRRAGSENLCLAGLLADNRALVARLAADGPFRRVFVPGAPGKAGGALGAALFAHHALEGAQRRVNGFSACAWGESIDERAEPGAVELGKRALDELATRLQRGELVGWVRGALEFSPRSAGRRVALALPRGDGSRSRLQSALRHVEAFLPCRIAVAEERAGEFFELSASVESLVRRGQVLVPAHERLRALAPDALRPDGRAWPLVVDAKSDPELHGLLARIGEAQGAPLLYLTDLALRGSPLVRSEAEAVEALGRSGLDALIAESRLYVRG